MKARYLYIYLLGMREELYAAMHARTRIREAALRAQGAEAIPFAERDDLEEVDAQADLRAAIEALLSASARLSLYIFPSPEPRAGARGSTRAREIRQRLGIAEDHALSKREPRNSWMHLDEAIDSRVWEGEGEAHSRAFWRCRLWATRPDRKLSYWANAMTWRICTETS